MKKLLFFTIVLVAFSSCNKNSPVKQELSIIPKPVKIEYQQGTYEIPAALSIGSKSAELESLIQTSSQVLQASDHQVSIENFDKADVQLSLKKSTGRAEGYILKVTKDNITINGDDEPGLFYGIQTLFQILEMEGNTIPCLQITDYPRFSWRGMHLDVCRHFFDINFVKKYIDYLAAYKMNVFHWHLTEDQGWRLEISQYPKLTEVAAWRMNPDGKRYGGFYTQEEAREIVEYAKKRYITVLPEIEMPGHSTAAIYAYPEIGCTEEGPDHIPAKGGIYKDVMNPGKEETFTFVKQVLDEVVEIFPSKYIHIGGDECPKDQWESNALCQKRIKEEGLEDEHELQSYFIKRVENILQERGRKLIGWDEILEGGLAPEATVMSWRGFEGGIKAAEQGHDVVMAPSDYVYLNKTPGDPEYEEHGRKPPLRLKTVYAFDPVPDALDDSKTKHVLGGHGCMWSEPVPTPSVAEYMLFPRFFALSEAVWTPFEVKNYEDFKRRMLLNIKILKKKGINFRIPSPEGVKGQHILTQKPHTVRINNPLPGADGVIRYTTDGSTPDMDAEVYNETLTLNKNTMLKARYFMSNEEVSNTVSAQYYFIDPDKNGLNCKYYEGAWSVLPDYDALEPLKTGRVYNIEAGVLAEKEDNYALQFSGIMKIDNPGEYTFYTSSDDGSRLAIDGKRVVINDGVHGVETKTGKIFLDKGEHKIQVDYFEGGGGQMLEVGTMTQAGERIPLDPSVLFFE